MCKSRAYVEQLGKKNLRKCFYSIKDSKTYRHRATVFSRRKMRKNFAAKGPVDLKYPYQTLPLLKRSFFQAIVCVIKLTPESDMKSCSCRLFTWTTVHCVLEGGKCLSDWTFISLPRTVKRIENKQTARNFSIGKKNLGVVNFKHSCF